MGEGQPDSGEKDRAGKEKQPSHGEGPDVYLDVPLLKVDEISLEVENLEAHVSLSAGVLDLLKLNVGADAILGKVDLEIKGVEAQALLEVRLDNVAVIVDRVLTTLDRNPEILQHIGRGVESAARGIGSGTGKAVGDVGAGAKDAVAEVGRGAGDAVDDVGRGTGDAVQGVGEATEQAGAAVGGVAAGMGHSETGAGEDEDNSGDDSGDGDDGDDGGADRRDASAFQNALRDTHESVRDLGRVLARIAANQTRSSR
jgi:hypothetical protein